MKTILYIFFLLAQTIVHSQPNWYKYSSVDSLWKYVGNAGFSANEAWYTNLAISPSGQPYVAYADYAMSRKATVMKFNGTNWVNVGNAGFSAGDASSISLAFSPTDGEPYLAYIDGGNGMRATVKKFDDTSWVNVGNGAISLGSALYTSLAFSLSGEPTVAFQDYGNSHKATVMEFNGTNWVNVGNPDFSTISPWYISLAFSPTDSMPYVAFTNFGTDLKATVMKLNGTNWVYVGNEGFSVSAASGTSLAFSTSGEPYVAFLDNSSNPQSKVTVMMFNGNNWVNVGNAVFSAGQADTPSLAFSPSDGEPYVAYTDYANSYKATVMKFNGNNWVNVGNAGFSAGEAFFTSLVFNQSGNPYVAFMDDADSNKATVMKYDSVFVRINEHQPSHFLLYPNPTATKLTIDLKNLPGIIDYLEITDIRGMKITEVRSIERKIILDIESFPSGIYIVRLKMDDSVYTGKFCKN